MTNGTTEQPIVLRALDDRIPNWTVAELKKRNCPFCGTQGNPAYKRPDGLLVNSCSLCGAFFVAESPTMESLGVFYKDYANKHRKYVSLGERAARATLKRDPMSDFRIAEICSVLEPRGKKVLDIGCGDGTSLVDFKKLGANVHGIDLDVAAINFVRNKLGIQRVINCSFEDFRADSFYDVILMFDFIEHPIEPLPILQKACRLLDPNGLLAIWTPNASFIRCFQDPTPLRVDLEHMQYVSFETCNYLADALGLNVIHLESIGFPIATSTSIESRNSTHMNLSRIHTCTKSLKMHTAESIPGLLKLCRLIRDGRKNDRLGYYHLFCILQK